LLLIIKHEFILRN